MGGANEYVTRGIPRAWLISAKGEVVWEGHPSSLSNGQIEDELKKVRLTPEFSLPEDLKKAEAYLNAGRLSQGVKALERYLKRPKDAEVATAAKDAIAKVNAFGKEKWGEVLEYKKEGEYGDALEGLASIAVTFKGLDLGDKAKKTISEWKKDKVIKVEISALPHLEKAKAYIKNKDFKKAGGILNGILKSSRFKDTHAQKKAQKLYDKIEGYL